MAKYLDGTGLGILWDQIKSTFALSSHDHDSAYVKIDGSTKMTGPLTIQSSINNNYNEGIRIEDAGNKWAGITLGAVGTTGITPQAGEVAWFIAKRPGGGFIIAPNSSSNDTGLHLTASGDIKWRTNVMLHLGNYTSYCATANHGHSNYLPKAEVSSPQDSTYGDSNTSWAIDYAASHPQAFVYNSYGAEYSYLIGMNSNNNYGAILKMGYADKYLRILRKNNNGWQSTDWEKISAGYADTAGSASSADSVAWTGVSSTMVGGNEFNICDYDYQYNSFWINYLPRSNRTVNPTLITEYHLGNLGTGYATLTTNGFIKSGSNNSYVLLGGGGTKAVSDFATSDHNHDGSYLKLSGGTLSGSGNVLNITSNNSNSWIYYNTSGGQKASTGYYAGLAFVANEATYARIGVNDSGTPEYWPSSSGSNKQTLLHTGNYTSYCATSGHNHDSAYIKLDGTNVMTGDLTLRSADLDRFIVFSYSGATSPTADSWRTGVLGTGYGDANYYVVQYQRINTSSATWNTAFRIGQDTGIVDFTNNVTIGGGTYTNIHSGNYTSYCATSGHNHDSSYVLKSGDTMTGALGITDSRNAWAMRSLQILAPNIGAGSAPMIQIGKEDSEKNVGQVYFYYSGTSGSNSNRLSLGLHSQDDVLNIMGSGNVGIGTTNPTTKLEVKGDLLINNDFNSNDHGIFFRSGFTSSNYKYNVSILAYDHSGSGNTPDGLSINGFDGISFSTGSDSRNEVMRITGGNSSPGNVGIGTSSPSQKLHINGGVLRVVNNGVSLTIGPENSAWSHFESSAPFYFSTSIAVDGTLYPYSNGNSLGVSGNRWNLVATGGNFSDRVSIQTQTKTKSSPVSQQLVINGPDFNENDTTSLQSAPGIGFHYPGRTWASLVWNGSFCGVSSDFNGYVSFTGSGFIKSGSDDSYVLLGGGGHKAETSLNAGSIGGYAHTAFVKKSDVVDNLRISYNALAAKYCAATNPVYWRITLPKPDVWCMIQITCSLIQNYSEGKNAKIVIYGTCHGSADWYGFRANVWGYGDTIKVYGSDKKYIYIYTNSAWETLSVDKIIVSDGITGQDISAVSIDWVSELPATYQTADTMYGLHTGNFSSYAATSGHDHDSRYLKLTGGTLSNTLIITGESNWREGIRINEASNGWTTLTMGGSATYGTGANIWSFHTYQGNFYLAKNGSDSFTEGISHTSGRWLIKGSGNNYEVARFTGHSAHTGISIEAGSSYNPFIRFANGNGYNSEIGYSVSGGNFYIGQYNSDIGIVNVNIANSRVGIGTSSPETTLDVNGIQQIYQRGNDNTAFKDLLLLKQQNSSEDSGQNFSTTYPSFGIGFRRYWTNSSGPYGETTCAGIYTTMSSSWRGGLIFRTKNNETQGGTHDTTALRLRPDGVAEFTRRIDAANLGNTASYEHAAIQIREYGLGGSQSDTWGNAPRLAWHWAGRNQTQIGMASNQDLYVSKDNFSHAYRIVTEEGKTWGINISGNAGSAGVSSRLSGPDHRDVDNTPAWYMSNIGKAGIYSEFCMSGGAVSSKYENRTTFVPWSDYSGERPVQLAFNGSGMYMRTSSSDTAWNSWNTIIHSGNIASSIPTLTNAEIDAICT